MPTYTADEIFRLIDAVEADGGRHLDKLHENAFHTSLCGPNIHGHEVAYCNEAVLFEVPYPQGNVIGLVEACAVDDWMGRWPRYAAANAGGTP